jgi:hypothetical protein
VDPLGGVLIAMWNYMGWDNLSDCRRGGTPAHVFADVWSGVAGRRQLFNSSVARSHALGSIESMDDGRLADIEIAGGETLAIAIALAGGIELSDRSAH